MLITSNTHLKEDLKRLNLEKDKANINIFSIKSNQQ